MTSYKNNMNGLTSSNMSRRTLEISHFATISINAPEEVNKNNCCGNASWYICNPNLFPACFNTVLLAELLKILTFFVILFIKLNLYIFKYYPIYF